MTPQQIDSMKLALEALEESKTNNDSMEFHDRKNKAITALEEALKEHAMRETQRLGQEIDQEPVAWGVDWGKAGDIACVSIIKRLPNDVIELVAVEYAPYSYTAQPQRTWVGLTDEEIDAIADEYLVDYRIPAGCALNFARDIEAAHGIKGDA